MKLTNRNAAILALSLLSCACGGSRENQANEAGANQGGGGTQEGNAGQASSGAPAQPVTPPPIRLNVGDRTLSAPSDFQVAVAFYNILGLDPPFNDWARADPRSRSANEFERAEIAGRIQQELLLAAQGATGIGFIELNTNSNFGEYDMSAQGFRLAELDSSRFYSWNYNGKTYRLTMENGNAAQLWRIPQAEARTLVENGGSRRVDLKLRFRIVGAIPESNGGGTLQGRIVGYQVLDQSGRRVGEMTFP